MSHARTTLKPTDHLRLVPGRDHIRRKLVPDSVLAMMIFIMTETMLFAGFISAFLIVRASSASGWPPPGQPRLPAEATAFNTAALLLSGVLMYLAQRRFERGDRAQRPFVAALVLGSFFVLFQGVEWVGLLSQGLTLTSSQHGSFFFLIVGLHALHAVVALGALAWAYLALYRQKLTHSGLWAVALLWYFVVCVWPVLYLTVYL